MVLLPRSMSSLLSPPCKEVADGKAKGAIIQDEKTGAVVFNPKVKIKPADFKEIREACPYDIPRFLPAQESWRNARCVLTGPKRGCCQPVSRPAQLVR